MSETVTSSSVVVPVVANTPHALPNSTRRSFFNPANGP